MEGNLILDQGAAYTASSISTLGRGAVPTRRQNPKHRSLASVTRGHAAQAGRFAHPTEEVF
jgi:hypothetical protein